MSAANSASPASASPTDSPQATSPGLSPASGNSSPPASQPHTPHSGADTPTKAGNGNALSFHQIYEAYNTLSDDDARALYDLERRRAAAKGSGDQSHARAAPPPRVAATLDLESFEAVQDQADDEEITFCHPCRCGNQYVLSSTAVLSAEERAQETDASAENYTKDSHADSNGDGADKARTLLQCSGCSEVVQVVWSTNAEDEDLDSEGDGEI